MRKNTKKSSRVEIFLKNWLAFLWKYVLIQKNHQLKQVVIWNLTTTISLSPMLGNANINCHPSPLAWNHGYHYHPNHRAKEKYNFSYTLLSQWKIKRIATCKQNKYKFFPHKVKEKSPSREIFEKIMIIFSWEFRWTFLDFPGLLRLSYTALQKIQTNFLFRLCILPLAKHFARALRPQ